MCVFVVDCVCVWGENATFAAGKSWKSGRNEGEIGWKSGSFGPKKGWKSGRNGGEIGWKK